MIKKIEKNGVGALQGIDKHRGVKKSLAILRENIKYFEDNLKNILKKIPEQGGKK